MNGLVLTRSASIVFHYIDFVLVIEYNVVIETEEKEDKENDLA